jgi:UDPglucose 6-dehydrogenase
VRDSLELCDTALAAAEGADALVICTAWPEYREVLPAELLSALKGRLVIDAAGFLAGSLGAEPSLRYARVGSQPLDAGPDGAPLLADEVAS